ncbi:unnamed protein product [Vitrella brassicaformis CCMP3155]|uniref:Uncharacterized protein n=1 Tax=Vitrella brassicaformis (strain CCMP3155) TaxID=1169540 RepID=A0A0G4FUH8_VITBC|nr:unnamed protein product [Vitrella brassicaformis CCMP3155]|eukprot:CEM18596.1 unnamed protein product [Vitrella brassicaformis CCMP3155]
MGGSIVKEPEFSKVSLAYCYMNPQAKYPIHFAWLTKRELRQLGVCVNDDSSLRDREEFLRLVEEIGTKHHGPESGSYLGEYPLTHLPRPDDAPDNARPGPADEGGQQTDQRTESTKSESRQATPPAGSTQGNYPELE